MLHTNKTGYKCLKQTITGDSLMVTEKKTGLIKTADINLIHAILTPAEKEDQIPGNESRNEIKGMTQIAHGQTTILEPWEPRRMLQ